MKNYEITEEQIKELSKGNAKVKKWFPEVFETKLEAGKWYKGNRNFLFCFNGNRKSTQYGFAVDGKYSTELLSIGVIDKNFTLATDSEVLEALTNEAKEKYKVGDCVKCVYDKNIQPEIIEHLNFSYMKEFNTLVSNKGFENSAALFDNGKWAEIVKTYTKEEAEKMLNAKIVCLL